MAEIKKWKWYYIFRKRKWRNKRRWINIIFVVSKHNESFYDEHCGVINFYKQFLKFPNAYFMLFCFRTPRTECRVLLECWISQYSIKNKISCIRRLHYYIEHVFPNSHNNVLCRCRTYTYSKTSSSLCQQIFNLRVSTLAMNIIYEACPNHDRFSNMWHEKVFEKQN